MMRKLETFLIVVVMSGQKRKIDMSDPIFLTLNESLNPCQNVTVNLVMVPA